MSAILTNNKNIQPDEYFSNLLRWKCAVELYKPETLQSILITPAKRTHLSWFTGHR